MFRLEHRGNVGNLVKRICNLVYITVEWNEYMLFGALEWSKIGDLTTQYSR
jgi:hypothetical protein